MYKDELGNIEIYFVCNKKADMQLLEIYYDEILDTHYWYFNAYLAYKYWKNNFEGLNEFEHNFLTVAANTYVMYAIEHKLYKTKRQHHKYIEDLKKLKIEIDNIIKEDSLFANL